MTDWIDFYDSDHPIYVNAKHRDAHFADLARDLIGLIPSQQATVLDYACGEALNADRVAEACGALILAEPAPSVRARLEQRFSRRPKISVLSLDQVKDQPAASIDLAVMNSVSQYMTQAQLDDAFAALHRLLKPTGRLVVGDVLRPDVGPLGDASALLGYAAHHGFFWAALGGLARMALSDYRSLRGSLGLATYSESQMLQRLANAGFSAKRCPANLGFNSRRMTFVASPTGR